MIVMMEMNVILRLSTLAAMAMLKFALVSALFVHKYIISQALGRILFSQGT